MKVERHVQLKQYTTCARLKYQIHKSKDAAIPRDRPRDLFSQDESCISQILQPTFAHLKSQCETYVYASMQEPSSRYTRYKRTYRGQSRSS